MAWPPCRPADILDDRYGCSGKEAADAVVAHARPGRIPLAKRSCALQKHRGRLIPTDLLVCWHGYLAPPTGHIAIWRTRTGTPVTTALKLAAPGNDVTFFRDGRLLAVAL